MKKQIEGAPDWYEGREVQEKEEELNWSLRKEKKIQT